MSRHDPMMIKSILFAAVLLTCFPRGQSSNPHDEPKNTAVKLGDDAILRCNIAGNASVIWDFYDVGKTRKDDSRLVSNRGVILEQFHGNYTLNRTLPGQNDLVIRSVQVEDAGIYECTRGLHSRPSAHLNVLSEPVCGVRDEKGVVMSVNRGGKIRLSCVFHQLAGHCKPVMEWSIDNGTFVSRTMLNDTKPESRRVVLESNFTVMELGVEKVIFTCAIIFTCPSNDYYFKNLSTIDPDYRYVCKSFEILVLDSTETEKYTVSTSIIQSHEAGPGGATHNIQSRVLYGDKTTAVIISLLSVIAVVVLLMFLAKIRRGIRKRCYQQCQNHPSDLDVYADTPRSNKGSHTSSVKQIDWKERSSLSTHTSDNHSVGYATSPRKVSLPSLPRPASIDNELIATYAETRIFASNIFMSCGSTSQLSQQSNTLVEDNAFIYSKVFKPKPSNSSDLASVSSKSSRNKQGTVVEDPRLEKHVNDDILSKYRRVGADGTTYSELDGFGSQHNRRNQPSSQQVRQNKPIYADMDHTLRKTRPPAPLPTISLPE